MATEFGKMLPPDQAQRLIAELAQARMRINVLQQAQGDHWQAVMLAFIEGVGLNIEAARAGNEQAKANLRLLLETFERAQRAVDSPLVVPTQRQGGS